MAADTRSARVDYKSLNSLSSVILYNTGKKPRGRYYKVERVIEKKRLGKVSINFFYQFNQVQWLNE